MREFMIQSSVNMDPKFTQNLSTARSITLGWCRIGIRLRLKVSLCRDQIGKIKDTPLLLKLIKLSYYRSKSNSNPAAIALADMIQLRSYYQQEGYYAHYYSKDLKSLSSIVKVISRPQCVGQDREALELVENIVQIKYGALVNESKTLGVCRDTLSTCNENDMLVMVSLRDARRSKYKIIRVQMQT